MAAEQSDHGCPRRGEELGTHNDNNQAEPAFRPLSNSRASCDQLAPRDATVAQRVARSHSSAQQLPHPLSGSRFSRDQSTSNELEWVAGAKWARVDGASAQGTAGDGIVPVHGGRKHIALLSLLFVVGIIIGIGVTAAMLAPSLSRSVRSLAAVAQRDPNLHMASSHESDRSDGGASIARGLPPHASDPANSTAKEAGDNAHPDGESPEQKLGEIQQRLDALEKTLNTLPRSLSVEPPRIASEGGVATLPVQNEKTAASGQSNATSPPHSVQIEKAVDRAAVSAIAELADANRANLNASHVTPEDSAIRSEQASRSPVQVLPSSAQGAQPGSRDARLRQDFEQFLNERQQSSSSPHDREKLFADFKKLISKDLQLSGSAGEDAPATSGSTRRIEIWRALDTTNLRELASAASTVIGEVAKGSTFRVMGRSEDGKWLKIETSGGLTGYYWAARAREMR